MRQPLPFWSALVVMLLLVLASATPAMAEAPGREVMVSGSAEVRAMPDRARLQMTVDTVDADIETAQRKVNDIVRRYLQTIGEAGMPEGAVSTSGLRVSPEYRWDNEARRNELIGYRVQREIMINVTDLGRLGDYLLGATHAGINEISPPELMSSRAVELEREALALAAADARERAQILARAVGATVGNPLRLDAQQHVGLPPMPMMRAAAGVAADSGNVEIGLVTGEIVFRAQVQASFELELGRRR